MYYLVNTFYEFVKEILRYECNDWNERQKKRIEKKNKIKVKQEERKIRQMILYPTRIKYIFSGCIFTVVFFYPVEIHLNGGGSNGGACNNNNNIIPKVGWLSSSSLYTKRLFFL